MFSLDSEQEVRSIIPETIIARKKLSTRQWTLVRDIDLASFMLLTALLHTHILRINLFKRFSHGILKIPFYLLK